MNGQGRSTPRGDFLGEPAAGHDATEPGAAESEVVERAPGMYATPGELATEGYGKRAELPSRRPATEEG